MNERERIIAILNEAHQEYYSHMDFAKTYIEALADHLIANGVTVSEEVEELKADNQRLCEMWAKAVSDLSKAEASLIKAQRWIPASEPPKESGEYNVMIKGGVVATSLFYSKLENGWYEFNDDDYVEPHPVTHWQPMPTPPKEEE